MRSILSFASVVVLLSACTANVDNTPPQTPGKKTATLEYVGTCTPAVCDGLPVLAIACAEAAKTTHVCAPGSDGACRVSVTCDGGGSTSDSGTTSFRPCEEAKCGPIPAIGCGDGATLTQQCGSENDRACAWVTTCTPKPGDRCDASSCGPVPAYAPICDDGSTGELDCRQSGDRCAWVPSCK